MAKKSDGAKGPITALKWLEKPEKSLPKSVCAVFGKESFLRRKILAKMRALFAKNSSDGEDYSTSFDGTTAEWSQVCEELETFSMFGPSVRLVIVEGADKFAADHSEQLENLLEQPFETGVLVLELETCAANTRLYKCLLDKGLLIDCRPLEGKWGASDELVNWMVQTAQEKHGFSLSRDAASVLAERVGTEMGLLNQELAKLTLVAEPGKPLTSTLVRQVSGTWKIQTTWVMMDFILAGKAKQALDALGKLLDAGEEPIAIVAGLAFTLRRMALITRKVLTESYEGRRPDTERAILESGVKDYFVDKTLKQLQWLGRNRCQEVLDQLVELDFDLKGDSNIPKRLLLERFVLRLAMPK